MIPISHEKTSLELNGTGALSASPPQPPYSLSPSVWPLNHSKQITRPLLANYAVPTVYYASLEFVTRIYNADPISARQLLIKNSGALSDGFLLMH